MSVLEADTPLPSEVISYGAAEDAVIDVHRPPSGTGPLLFLIHGGFWKAIYDRFHTRPMAAAFAEAGWVVATPEYRRVGNGGGWPTTYDDVRAAFAATLDALGASSAVVTGHSAGGHLALLLASDSPEVAACVPLAPVCSLQPALDLDLGTGATANFLAGSPLVDADPLQRSYSCPITIVHGINDDIVPVALSREFVQRHPDAELVELDCDHFEVIDPSEGAFEEYRAAVQKSQVNL